MLRRDFLRHAGASAAALAAFGTGAFATPRVDAKSCFLPFDANGKPFAWKAKPGPYKVAVANSLISNDWRVEMVKLARAYAARPSVRPMLAELTINSSGPEVAAQITQFEQLILKGVDVIVTNAASPTGLNEVIKEATDAGILVVSFDNVVTAPSAVLVNHDQTEMGRIWAQFVADEINGKGKVLMVRGVAGTFGDEVFTKGGMEVFKKYPGLELVQVNGDWDQGTAQKVTADALAAGHKFDGVWSQYGDTGVVRAFLQSGKTMPPMAGQSENGFRKLAAQHNFPILSAGVAPGLVAASMEAAFAILDGQSVPQSVRVPLDPVKTKDLKAGINYFPDLPDSFVAGFNVPQCGLQFTVEEIQSQPT